MPFFKITSCNIITRIMAGSKKIKVSPKKMVALLLKYKGNKSKIADALGVNRVTVIRMLKDDPRLMEEFQQELDRRIDTVEDSLYILASGIPKMVDKSLEDGSIQSVQEGWVVPPDPKAMKMMLDAKARDRGYGKQELVVNDGRPIEVLVTTKIIERGDPKPDA